MPTQLEILQELDRRGILPPDKKVLLDEAVNRGLVPPSPDVTLNNQLPPPSPQMSIGEKAYNVIAPTIDMAGLTAGGLLGATTGPLTAVSGAGLGYAGARRITQGLGEMLGYASPETLPQSFINAGKDILTGSASEMLGQSIEPVYMGAKEQLGKLARKLYESAIKPIPSLPAETRNEVIQTGLERAISGQSYRPTDTHVVDTWKEVNNLVQQADDIVSNAAGSGDMISLKNLASAVDDITTKFGQGPFPKQDISKLIGYKNQLLSKYGVTEPINATQIPAQYDKLIPVDEALSMKKFIYRMAEKYYNNPNVSIAPAKIEAEKAVARAIKSELENLYPATKPLNEEASKLIDFGNVLERAANRTGNRELFSIFDFLSGTAGATISGGPGAATGGFLSYTITNPQFKAFMAKQIYKASVPNIVKVQVLGQLTRMGSSQIFKNNLPPPVPIIPHNIELPEPIGAQ